MMNGHPPDESEQTPEENPFARQLAEIRRGYAALRKAVDESEQRVMTAILSVGERTAKVELSQKAYESRTIALEERLSTLPCPPPSEAAGAGAE